MSQTDIKNIMFYGKTNDEYLAQFTKDRLEQWIQSKFISLGPVTNHTIRIFFLRSGEEKEVRWVGCEASIEFGEVTFESRSLQPDSYDAVASAIKKLRPVIANTRASLSNSDRVQES